MLRQSSLFIPGVGKVGLSAWKVNTVSPRGRGQERRLLGYHPLHPPILPVDLVKKMEQEKEEKPEITTFYIGWMELDG
jgi:hypothetical protein